MGAVKLQVGPVRDLNLRVGSDPLPTNGYYGQIWDVKDTKRTKLHKLVIGWVVPIPNVLIEGRHHVAPGVSQFGKTVQQQNERPPFGLREPSSSSTVHPQAV